MKFFDDESEAEQIGPQEVELMGCICGAAGHRFLVGPSFTLYRPVQDASSIGFPAELRTRTEEKYEFGVQSQAERNKWVLFVQEATQISESWSRIRQFYESLRSAQSQEMYVRAISRVAHETMVIPAQWVQHREGQVKITPMEQVKKDLQRDKVVVDGRMFQCPTLEDVGTDVVLRLLDGINDGTPDMFLKAVALAKDVLVSCSRTQGNGDTYDAVCHLFNSEDLVHCAVDSASADPVSVRVLRQNGTESVLQENFLNHAGSTGLPQFQSDESAKKLDIEQVRGMALDVEQKLQVVPAAQDAWVPDWEMLQCMRCGVQFRAWVRRHHCRKCGALICSSCSQHFLALTVEGADKSPAKASGRVRVCFLCYQKAVIEDLSARKEVTNEDHAAEPSSEEVTSTIVPSSEDVVDTGGSKTPPSARKDTPPSMVAEETLDDSVPWPVVSVEMGSRYKICSMENLETLYILDCRYVRQVRWNGIADSGRIVISIAPP